MYRLNVFLLLVVAGCAMGVITSQHRARLLFQQLEAGQARADQLDIEYDQLNLELSTWANHARIDQVAREHLHMRLPDRMERVLPDGRTQVVTTAVATAQKKTQGAR